MTQSGVIAASLLGGFIAFIVLKGRVGDYVGALLHGAGSTGAATAPSTDAPAATTGKTASNDKDKAVNAAALASNVVDLFKGASALKSGDYSFVMHAGGK